jgi:hypothetical protein
MIVSEFFMLIGTYAVFRNRLGHSIPIASHLVRPVIAGVVTSVVLQGIASPDRTKPLITLLVGSATLLLYFAVLWLLGGLPEEIKSRVSRRT